MMMCGEVEDEGKMGCGEVKRGNEGELVKKCIWAWVRLKVGCKWVWDQFRDLWKRMF